MERLTDTSQFLYVVVGVAVLSALSYYLVMGVIKKGPSNKTFSSQNISEEERAERRRRALQRFGGGGAVGSSSKEDGSVDDDQRDRDQSQQSSEHARGEGTLLLHEQPLNDNESGMSQSLSKGAVSNAVTVSANDSLAPSISAATAPADVGAARTISTEDAKVQTVEDIGIALSSPAAPLKAGVSTEVGLMVIGDICDNSVVQTKDGATMVPAGGVIVDSTGISSVRQEPNFEKRNHDIITSADRDSMEEGVAEAGARKRAEKAPSDVANMTKKIKTSETELAEEEKEHAKYKRRPQPPPAQLLCEVLSVVCGTDVTVKGSREGWIQKKKPAFGASKNTDTGLARSNSKIILPLTGHATTAPPKDDWTQLEQAFESITSSSSMQSNPFRHILVEKYEKGTGLVAAAASWHGKTHGPAARDVVRNAIQTFGSSKDGNVAAAKDGLRCCLKSMANFTSKMLALWLDTDVCDSSTHEQQDESVFEEDLFSDYSSSNAQTPKRVTAAGHSSIANTALGELFELCARPSPVLTKRLMSDIVVHSRDGPWLVKGILQRALDCLPGPQDDLSDHAFSFDSIAHELDALSYLTSTSPDVAMALVEEIRREAAEKSSLNDGYSFELSSILRPLLSLGAYTAPYVGFEKEVDQGSIISRNYGARSNSRAVKGFRFYDALKDLDEFPLGYYDYSQPFDPTFKRVIDEAQAIMGHARKQASRMLASCMKKKIGNGKDTTFRWLLQLVNANEMQVNLLQEQLLDEKDSAHGYMSSRPFLLGAAFTLLEVCCDDLCFAYEKNGVDTFDARYLVSENGAQIASSDERRLFGPGYSTSHTSDDHTPETFSGATEFFFITSALLRVSLFPAIRVRDEYLQKHKRAVAEFSRLAKSPDKNKARLYESHKRIAAGHVGWNTCLDDQDMMRRVVKFFILQLRFLADLSGSDGAEALLAVVPESMVKHPAQYIAHVALRFQKSLTPSEAESAVKYATVLLGSRAKLSIQVQTELIRISGAFIGAGVQREVTRQRRKHRSGRRRGSNKDDFVVDKRVLDIYTSLDRSDHGVVVFSSPVASKQLGPVLINMFVAMDSVEGVDVERENNFHKNMVQGELSELILRLWCHPSGEFRRSITSLDISVLSSFFRSVSASISIESDTVYQTVLDIRDVLEHHVKGRPFSRQATARLASCYDRLPSFLGALRRLLLILVYLSQDEKIAALLGGCSGDNDGGSASSDVGIVIVSLLDKFTSPDGGTSPEVDFRVALKRAANMALDQTSLPSAVRELLDARTFATDEFGFDVSAIAHLLMALATRFGMAAAANKRRGHEGPSVLIKSITSHSDFNIHHFQCVFDRLIVATQHAEGAGGDQKLLVQADGYVDSSIWYQYETPNGIALEESSRQRKQSIVQDQLTHSVIDGIASVDQIKSFLVDLGKELSARGSISMPIAAKDEDIPEMERHLLQGQSLGDEEYTKHLKDWVVSSDSFSSESTGVMQYHFYSSNARTSSNPILGRVLLKDARSCWKHLPRPHPNASIFVCYAEERMDICKGMIVGATGTPYSMGLFLFDICYPQLYPSAAPMVHFMTTGGGQVRFSPNLYNDGKVCLSLLGTTGAWDESQRWNPNESSLAQVLLSIQSQILDVAEPYFTEGGGHGGLEGTPAGRKGSARYNNTLRLSTLRHAIIEPLKSPPKGYEIVTRRHFAMCRKRLIVQAKIWTLESKGTSLHGRFMKAYSELVGLLSSGKNLTCEDWELADAGGNIFGALPPLSDDLLALQRLDRTLYNAFDSALHLDDSSQSNGDEEVEDELEQVNEAMFARALELSLEQGGN